MEQMEKSCLDQNTPAFGNKEMAHTRKQQPNQHLALRLKLERRTVHFAVKEKPGEKQRGNGETRGPGGTEGKGELL